MVVFFTKALVWCFVPDTTPVATDFNSFRPMPATAVCPTPHFDGSIVNDDRFVDGADDGRGDGHVLNRETGTVRGVVLPSLRSIIQIFFLLHWSLRGFRNGIDAGQPFNASTDVFLSPPYNNDKERPAYLAPM